MPNEFRMSYSPEVIAGIVEQIREELRAHDEQFQDRASIRAVEAARLAIELELARRMNFPEQLSEVEAKVKAYHKQTVAELQKEMARTLKEQYLDSLLAEEEWFGKALMSFAQYGAEQS